jgi:hypothetical protein
VDHNGRAGSDGVDQFYIVSYDLHPLNLPRVLFRSNALIGTGDGAREDDYPVIRPNLERHFQAVIIANFVLNRRFQLEIILPTGASGDAEREENKHAQQAESDVTRLRHKVNPCKVRCSGASGHPEGF